MKKVISTILIATLLAGCSTAGGIYKENDPVHGEFSLGRTALSALAVVGVIAAARYGGGGSDGAGYAWDYQPGNGQWVCRDKSNGQYAYAHNCAGVPKYDYWP